MCCLSKLPAQAWHSACEPLASHFLSLLPQQRPQSACPVAQEQFACLEANKRCKMSGPRTVCFAAEEHSVFNKAYKCAESQATICLLCAKRTHCLHQTQQALPHQCTTWSIICCSQSHLLLSSCQDTTCDQC